MTAGFWQQMPFIRLIIPFITGIVVQQCWPFNNANCLYLLICSAIAFFVVVKRVQKYTLLWTHGFLLNLLMSSFGISLTYVHNNNAYTTTPPTDQKQQYIIKIDEPLLLKKNAYKATAVLYAQVDSLHKIDQATGKLLVYFKKDSSMPVVRYGDVLLIKSQIQEISFPANPGEFNYRRYMAARHIYLQAYLKPGSFVKLPVRISNPLVTFAQNSQEYIKHTLQQYISGNKEMGVGEALLFGFDDDIDQAVFQSYSRTGTLHVLAVSGMHVGLIFMVLGWLLQPLQKLKRMYLLRPALLLAGIWLYSLLCGMSPSILRATIMLTFLVIGEVIKRRSSAYNSLAASAFLLLAYDPLLAGNVGFQLSYAAVLGIVAFYQPLYECIDLQRRFPDATWKVVAVSLAAQAFTFPLSLYYFHQFPNYFLLANLLIIPLTTIVIYVGILLLIFSKVVLIAGWLGIAMKAIIAASNYVALCIEHLPFSYADNISFTLSAMILVYLCIMAAWIYATNRDLLFLRFSLLCVLCIACMRAMNEFTQLHQQKLLIYSVKDHVAIQHVKGHQAMLLADSLLLADGGARAYHFSAYNCLMGITAVSDSMLSNRNTCISLYHKKRLLLLATTYVGSKQTFNWVLVFGKQYCDLGALLHKNKVGQLLFNPGVPMRKRQALMRIAAIHHIPCYDLKENGAFEVIL